MLVYKLQNNFNYFSLKRLLIILHLSPKQFYITERIFPLFLDQTQGAGSLPWHAPKLICPLNTAVSGSHQATCQTESNTFNNLLTAEISIVLQINLLRGKRLIKRSLTMMRHLQVTYCYLPTKCTLGRPSSSAMGEIQDRAGSSSQGTTDTVGPFLGVTLTPVSPTMLNSELGTLEFQLDFSRAAIRVYSPAGPPSPSTILDWCREAVSITEVGEPNFTISCIWNELPKHDIARK